MSQAELQMYPWAEIAKHDKDTDCWVVLYDKVLDVTSFLNEHPGGLDPIKDMGGQDITNSFESIGHSSTALLKSKTFIIGRVDTDSKQITGRDKVTEPKRNLSDMDHNDLLKYKSGGDIIPLWAIVAVLLALCALVYKFW